MVVVFAMFGVFAFAFSLALVGVRVVLCTLLRLGPRLLDAGTLPLAVFCAFRGCSFVISAWSTLFFLKKNR